MRVAAIDIGSNSLRLLIADFALRDGAPPSIRTVARAGESCRLARGLNERGTIDPEMADRAIGIAVEFADRARELGAERIVIGATAALRAADNGEAVRGSIEARTGIPVRILSGEEEARLVYRSVVTGFGPGARRSPCVVFDIGGGSTEVVSGVGGEPGRWVSLPFGAVTLTERHLRSNPPDPAEVAALEKEVRDIIMQECALMPSRTPLLAGVGGTVTVLALMDRGLTQYDPTQIEGWTIEQDRLIELTTRFLSSDLNERRRWPAMGEGRADIVAAGAVVVRLLAERFPAPSLMCSTQGLRYGLARLAAEELTAGQARTPDTGTV
jgi:exopolyphosphatase/guanosine-5'-triphosphate,3'-diphosphate pyrophosphatase